MDRHLLPDEIDQLLDGEVGFGTPPLKAHVRVCAECRAELEEARVLVRALEHLPNFAPSPLFAERVMTQVQLFVPWHIAFLDAVRGWVPRSRPACVVFAACLGSVALVLTVATLWLLTQFDTAVFAVNLGLERARIAVLDAAQSALIGALGEPALQALRSSGTTGLAVGVVGTVVLTVGAVRALRALVAGSRQR